MMLDFGDYALEVLSAYGISIVLLVVIVGRSMIRARKVRAQLAAVESRVAARKDTHDV